MSNDEDRNEVWRYMRQEQERHLREADQILRATLQDQGMSRDQINLAEQSVERCRQALDRSREQYAHDDYEPGQYDVYGHRIVEGI